MTTARDVEIDNAPATALNAATGRLMPSRSKRRDFPEIPYRRGTGITGVHNNKYTRYKADHLTSAHNVQG